MRRLQVKEGVHSDSEKGMQRAMDRAVGRCLCVPSMQVSGVMVSEDT